MLDFHACPHTGVSDDHLWHVVAANTANPVLEWWCKATDVFRDEGRESSVEASSDPPSAIRAFVDERGAVQTTPDWRAVELSSWVHEVLPELLVESMVPDGVVGVPAHREHGMPTNSGDLIGEEGHVFADSCRCCCKADAELKRATLQSARNLVSGERRGSHRSRWRFKRTDTSCRNSKSGLERHGTLLRRLHKKNKKTKLR